MDKHVNSRNNSIRGLGKCYSVMFFLLPSKVIIESHKRDGVGDCNALAKRTALGKQDRQVKT